MTVSVTHDFVCAIPDDAGDLAAGRVCQQAHWNAAHTVTGVVEVLTANLDLYVRTDGNDANTGLANTAGGAFLTIQRALDESGKYGTANFGTVIHVVAGTYTEDLTFPGMAFGGGYDIDLVGDNATPANVVLVGEIYCTAPGRFHIEGFRVQPAAGGDVSVANGAAVVIDNCELVNASVVSSYGAAVYVDLVTFSGNRGKAFHAWGPCVLEAYRITVSGTPNYSSAFLTAVEGSVVYIYAAPTGSATGKRYAAEMNAVVQAYGGGANYLPGDVAGTTATGGQYA